MIQAIKERQLTGNGYIGIGNLWRKFIVGEDKARPGFVRRGIRKWQKECVCGWFRGVKGGGSDSDCGFVAAGGLVILGNGGEIFEFIRGG